MSGPGYPSDRYTGPAGEVNASLRRADTPAELALGGGGAAHYLATGATTGGAFGLYRWEMGAAPTGPGPALPPRYHRVLLRAQRHGPALRR